jgi:two-component system alkaline phosphatase synthesis response regulator PhoP
MTKILVIEDDPDIALSLKYNLERSGNFEVTIAADGAAGLEYVRQEVPGMILLDLNLPGIDGTEVCKLLRQQESTSEVPIIMLTARTEEEDRIAGLDIGADDYVSKPFSVKELIARVRAVLRRSGSKEPQEQILTAGPVTVDLPAHRVMVAGETVDLTRKEFDLLTALIRSRGRVLTRDLLLERVWGYAYPGETRTVDVHIRRLRQKLGDRVRDHIETVVGVGYRFRSDP